MYVCMICVVHKISIKNIASRYSVCFFLSIKKYLTIKKYFTICYLNTILLLVTNNQEIVMSYQ